MPEVDAVRSPAGRRRQPRHDGRPGARQPLARLRAVRGLAEDERLLRDGFRDPGFGYARSFDAYARLSPRTTPATARSPSGSSSTRPRRRPSRRCRAGGRGAAALRAFAADARRWCATSTRTISSRSGRSARGSAARRIRSTRRCTRSSTSARCTLRRAAGRAAGRRVQRDRVSALAVQRARQADLRRRGGGPGGRRRGRAVRPAPRPRRRSPVARSSSTRRSRAVRRGMDGFLIWEKIAENSARSWGRSGWGRPFRDRFERGSGGGCHADAYRVPSPAIVSGPSGLTGDATPTFAFSSIAAARRSSAGSGRLRSSGVRAVQLAVYARRRSPTAPASSRCARSTATRRQRGWRSCSIPGLRRRVVGLASGLTDDPTPSFQLLPDEPGGSFQCRLGRRGRPATSRTAARRSRRFRARRRRACPRGAAIDAVGAVDATPDVRTFMSTPSPPTRRSTPARRR